MKKQINNPFDPKQAGKILKELRAKTGLTAKQVAEKIGSTETNICSYETGRRMPRDSIKVDLANFYNVRVEEIFFR